LDEIESRGLQSVESLHLPEATWFKMLSVIVRVQRNEDIIIIFIIFICSNCVIIQGDSTTVQSVSKTYEH